MQYQNLGASDLHISRIGFGCMSISKDAAGNEKIIHDALDKGINYFDTADIYDNGLNEALVGKALKPFRDKIYIATKVGNRLRPDGTGLDWDPSAKHIKTAAEKSLSRLQTDHIDLYQLHGGTMDDPIDETIDAFEQLKKEGKIRYYGISSIRPNVIREWVSRSSLASVMMQYSLLDRRPEEACLQLLKENNVGVLARGTLAQGLLVDKAEKEYLGRSKSEIKQAREYVGSIATPARQPSQLAMQFVLMNPAVTSAIAGIRTGLQLREAAASLEGEIMNSADYEDLCSFVPVNFYKEHR